MKIEQSLFTPGLGWNSPGGPIPADLVLAFGERDVVLNPDIFATLRQRYPEARILLGSTAGEIAGAEVRQGGVVATAIAFASTRVRAVALGMEAARDARAAGRALAAQFPPDGLVHVWVLSDGHHVNGSELAHGLVAGLPAHVCATGGLAGDGVRFERTVVGLDGPPTEGTVAAIGFYGHRLRVGCGSAGGWTPFGPERVITRSEANLLYELDGHSALALYKQYLGPHAADLPGASLRFPLCISAGSPVRSLVRTILSIDEESDRMAFAGDMPAGAHVRLMRATFDALIDGAATAAQQARQALGPAAPELALCVSCVGRRIVLGQRVEEEIASIREAVGPESVIAGFYSYGEIAPADGTSGCELHNQTMTITLLREDA